MLQRVHHINLLVSDLDAAVQRYTQHLGVSDWAFGDLPGRGVRTARFPVGESWIVLVQPTDGEGAPGRYLAAHGEGLFLLSFQVDSLDRALQALDQQVLSGEPRTGLDGWQVADLSPEAFFGAQLQLVEDRGSG